MSDCRDYAVQLGCYTDGAGLKTSVLIHMTTDHQGQPSVRITDVAGGIIAGATAANTSLGSCVAAVVPPSQAKVFGGGANIASGTQTADYDPNLVGSTWVWAQTAGLTLQSVTVTALEAGKPTSTDRVRVKFGPTGVEIYLVKGQSFTWSVSQDSGNVSEQLEGDFTVDCLGNAAANLVWTEQ